MINHDLKCTFNAENKSYSDKFEEMTKKVDELIDIAIFIKDDLEVPGSPFPRNPLARKGDKTHELGVIIAHYFKWNGEKIYETFSNALEDANYHTFNEKMSMLWRKENPKLKGTIKISRENFAKINDDFKNSTPGFERVLVYDEKLGSVSKKVEFVDDDSITVGE
jgi:hypothetical protein